MKTPSNSQKRAVSGTWTDLSFCGVCKDKLRRLSRSGDGLPSANNSCAVCAALLCSKCRVKRSFKVLTGHRKGPPTRSVHVVVCQSCLTFVRQQSVAKIAWQQNEQRLVQSNESTDSNRPTWGLLDDAITPGRHDDIFRFRRIHLALRIVEIHEAPSALR